MTIRSLLTRLLIPVLFMVAVPAFAVERTVTITAPAEVKPGARVAIVLAASTDAKDGEQIGFFHAEYSADGGATWTGLCFDQMVGVTATRPFEFPVGPAGTKAIVRVRIAFRGGKAGDVDFKGDAIQWDDSWSKWRMPPTKFAIIYVR